MDPVTDLIWRLSAATVVGGLIGLNREMKHKPAGLRTHALVALGAALATSLPSWSPLIGEAHHADAISRVVQGIITGIGFIGAGVIMRSNDGHEVHGLTTAASVWLAACIGCACGTGAMVPAAISLVLVLLILIFGGPLEHWAIGKLDRHAGDKTPPPA
jgi:putative Mg2+ transporter-C (MgtC) family protein